MTDKKAISEASKIILKSIGENPKRKGLQDTWSRRIPDMLEELSEGYREEEKPVMRTFDVEHNELVVKDGIKFFSMCEHHLLPFFGNVSIGYVPDGEVVGLSKLTRYTKWQSRKLTNQEELTSSIAEGLREEMNVKGVIVHIEAEHLCEQMRGVEGDGSTTLTSATRGVFEEDKTVKNEFYKVIGK